VSSFTKISNNNKFIYDCYDTKSELGIEEQISKVASSKSVISAPIYDDYESSDEGFQTTVLLPFVLEGTKLDHCEQGPVETLDVTKLLYFLLFLR